jgi:transposase
LAQRATARDQKKARACRGVVLFEDEASFWLDGTLHQTWSRVGVQPRVDTFGARKTAHVFGAVALDDARTFFQFADVFNGKTFWAYLQALLKAFPRKKLFVIIDNGPCHNLEPGGVEWLRANRHRMELHRLPPYSPEFNPTEGVWKVTRKLTTHNRFFHSTWERDIALSYTFARFHCEPALIEGHVMRFR